jgi:ABC-type Fe3+/spermidine/putrescine transport system ATPase subunit
VSDPAHTLPRPSGRAPAEAPAGAPGVEIEGLSKHFGDTRVLEDVSLTVPQREFHALLGPSGSGKTTILRIIAGFIAPDAGVVRVSGRDIGVVFQNYALFPHLNVFGNVAFGLRMRGIDKAEMRERVAETLALVRMTGFEARKPAELSGGQQQRIALARALVIRPKVLLLDEPLSALDRKIRGEVREELRRIQAETGVTAIIVTHDQEEALSLSHRMLVLDGGRVRQSGTPDEVYRQPVDPFVADFVGSFNALPVTVQDGTARVGAQSLPLPESARTVGEGPARLLVRPEQLGVRRADGDERPPGALRGRIIDVDFAGPVVTITVDIEAVHVRVLALSPTVLADPSLVPGAAVWVSVPAAEVRLAPAEGAAGG